MNTLVKKRLTTGLLLLLPWSVSWGVSEGVSLPAAAAVDIRTSALRYSGLDDLAPLPQDPRMVEGPLDCLLTPSMEVALASPVVGVIREIYVKRGDAVHQGDIVVELYAEVERARLRLDTAQAEYGERTIERNRELYERKLISEQEKEEIEINNRVFALEAEQTQARVHQKQIRTPVTGIVTERFLDPGEYAGAEPILSVARLNPLHVEVVFPVERYGSIKQGMQTQVVLAPPLGGTYDAQVEIVDRVLDAASGTFRVRLTLPNPDNRIPAGLKCNVQL
ncbi:MAG: membrane fusion protein (multidrug efflux system) [Motiliproteus sp.]|jgi:membrane fusion protein (multidrug efflux system)